MNSRWITWDTKSLRSIMFNAQPCRSADKFFSWHQCGMKRHDVIFIWNYKYSCHVTNLLMFASLSIQTIDSISSSRLKPKWLNENRQTNHKIILFSFGGLRGNAVIFKRPTSIPIYIYMTKFIMPKVWWYISKWNYSIFRLWKIGSDVAEYTWSSFKIRSKPKSVPIYGHIFYTK